MTWTPIEDFAENEIVRAYKMQAIYDNLENIVKPDYWLHRSNLSDGVGAPYASTTSATWVDVDSTDMRLIVEVTSEDGDDASPGRDVLVVANIVAYATTGDTVGALDLVVDGEHIGNTASDWGFALYYWNSQPPGNTFVFIISGLTPGEHELVFQFRRHAGTGAFRVFIFNRHWVYAEEI